VRLPGLFRRKGPVVMRPSHAHDALFAFTRWLASNPVDGDGSFGHSSVRYQVARYCEYLDSNPWPGGDPLRDAHQRKPVVDAYTAYLGMFNTPLPTIALARRSLDHFYLFLGDGARRGR